MYTSHQRPSYSYPHHTRYPQHTNTPTPITPDALSTQTHLPHHTRSLQHTSTSTPITPDALMRYTTIATSITPDTLLQLTTLHQISSLSRDPQLPTSHQMHSAHNHSYLHRPKSLGLTTYLVGRVPTYVSVATLSFTSTYSLHHT